MSDAVLANSRGTKLAGPSSRLRVLKRFFAHVLRATTLLIFLSPSIFGILYYGFVASDRYVSEAKFVVRSANQQVSAGGLASLLKLVGVSPTQSESHALIEYLTSPDAYQLLQGSHNLRLIYGHANADFLSRYPNLYYGPSDERFFEYLGSRISVSINPNSGICTLQVEAFTSRDAYSVNQQLLSLGEAFVNAINERMRKDTIKYSEAEVNLSNERLRSAERELTAFRNAEAVLDPSQNSTIVLQLIAQLTSELNNAEVEMVQTTTESPKNPRGNLIKNRIAALKKQISSEQSRLTSGGDSLSNKLSQYEKLTLDRQFAADALTRSLQSLEQAKADARRQQLYLEPIVLPGEPETAIEPNRIFDALSLIALNLIVLLVSWLLKNGIAEHAPRLGRKGVM